MQNNYDILENKNLPEILKNKPRWMFCVLLALSLLLVTLSAVLLGVFIGYMYCFIEQRSGKVMPTANLHIIRAPFKETYVMKKRTINDALVSNMLVTMLLNVGRNANEDIKLLQQSNNENKSETIKVFL